MAESVGLVETNSIPAGIEAGDAMLKAADVELVFAQAVCAGKYIVMVSGAVTAVRAAVSVGSEIAGITLVHDMTIANISEQVLGAISCCSVVSSPESLGIIETFSIATAVLCADMVVKSADVELIEVRLGRGLGGKSFVLLTGDVSAVQYAVDSAVAEYKDGGMLARTAVIPSPHPDILNAVF